MSQFVKTKRQANFKDFKRFGAFKGFVEQKNSFVLLRSENFGHQTSVIKKIILNHALYER
jgi:hypothetical protein